MASGMFAYLCNGVISLRNYMHPSVLWIIDILMLKPPIKEMRWFVAKTNQPPAKPFYFVQRKKYT